jgi:hypothetical protein
LKGSDIADPGALITAQDMASPGHIRNPMSEISQCEFGRRRCPRIVTECKLRSQLSGCGRKHRQQES